MKDNPKHQVELPEGERNKAKRTTSKTGKTTQQTRVQYICSQCQYTIRNTNMPTQTGANQQQLTEAAVTFNPNPVRHLYPTTDLTSREGRYKLPANDSIIRRAAHTPTNQITTNTTNAVGHNEQWRYNNRANADTQTNLQPCTTNPTGLNGLNISPNSSDQRIGPQMLQMQRNRPYETQMQS